ncbi:MAG: cupin domain-containing protein, partial [Actinomycetes bacterium]
MDVVSDAISAVRVGRPSSDRVRVGGSWCTRIAPYDGAGFHVVLAGSCWLHPDDGDSIRLGTGDAVLLPRGTGHVIADSRPDGAAVARAVPFEEWHDGAPRSGRGDVEMLCGKYRLDRTRAHPLLAELPSTVHLPHRVGSHPELRAVIDLLGRELDGPHPGTHIVMPGLLDLFLVYLIRSWMAEGGTGAWPAALSDPVTTSALQALHADPAAPWTTARLAAEAGV